ncbi:PAS domain S-box protein [Methanosarcina sp. KYL-1]|uniref:PAS domain S-box protein n=1 Tax=Methanosarcina sp. KYL-1 TaxID=2602068 RepID=UPI0021011E54|nr:PAS domain S-box protein [Methanosarcina sp. KYL-1]MCQ1534209.1 PAS domain S-box protein [Methanosarcina sp. KYL-1]
MEGEKIQEKNIKIDTGLFSKTSRSPQVTAVYSGAEELTELLVAYFKEGIEKGERCLWVTGNTLPADRAKKELENSGVDIEPGLLSTQLEFLPAKPLPGDAALLASEVAETAETGYKKALSDGFTGFRTNLELEKSSPASEKPGSSLMQGLEKCRKALKKLDSEKSPLVLCTLALEKLSASELLDLMERSEAAIIKRRGKWGYIGQNGENLKSSEEKFRNLFDHSNDAIVIFDLENNILEANEITCRTLGYTREEIMQMPIWKLKTPEYQEKIKEHRELIRQAGNAVFVIECLHKDGTVIPCEVSNRIIEYEGKQAILSFARDISERKKMEALQQEKMNFLQNMVDAIPTPVYYKDEKGKYIGCNLAFEKLMGKKKEEIIGKTMCEFGQREIHEKHHLRDLELIKKRGKEVYEASMGYPDGTIHRVIFNKVVLKGPSEEDSVLLGIVWDINEQKEFEKTLLKAKKDAEAANRIKDGFIANMSHELRTPLNSVIGFSDLLLEGTFGTLNTKQSQYVNNILRSGKHLLEIINNLLDISRLEAGEDYLNYEEVDVADLVDEVRLALIPFASNKKIAIKTRLDPAPGSIWADRAKFKQILYNLLSNAIKFTPKKGLVTVSACKKDGMLEIVVTDNGIGISRENQEKVFHPFVQEDSSSAKEYEGVGLGLYIVKNFVDLHGGEIRVDSEPGKGSTFTVTIPEKMQDFAHLEKEKDPAPGRKA